MYQFKYKILKRFFDISFSIILIIITLPIFIFISLIIFFSFNGPVLHWSKRVGRFNQIFNMPKFRTMRINTPNIATDLLTDHHLYITPVGSYLRKFSLDELPQLFSILIGDMSFVGPRPALFNQYKLINMRTKKKIHLLYPGITGWAQINGRDIISIEKKIFLDYEYNKKKSFLFDLYIIVVTFFKVVRKDDLSH